MKNIIIYCVVYGLFVVILASNTGSRRRYGICPWMSYKNSSCSKLKFLCNSGECIDRHFFCDGKDDCRDHSDEDYCSPGRDIPYARIYYPDDCENMCPVTRKLCDSNKCMPKEWLCDGILDCSDGTDEISCDHRKLDKVSAAVLKVLSWLTNRSKSDSANEIWGPLVDKLAVAFYFADKDFVKSNSGTRKELAYEVSIQLLSRLAKKKLQDISSTDLASFLNAFLVTCIDPRKFHGIDIVQELRNRVNNENFTNPYVLLSLCNAGERITDSDKSKLVDTFMNKRRAFWTDMQAFSVMGIVCTRMQQPDDFFVDIEELTKELKKYQYRNGTVENLQATALVMQALFAADYEDDPHNFNEIKALEQIMSSEKPDGSFGSLINTYFVLPVLSCQSLVNISSSHCKYVQRDEMSALVDLSNRSGPKKRIQYSLWIGDEKDVERNLVLRVPQNMSLYGIMEVAAEIDKRYSFEYVMKSGKPYIKAISQLQDNPEKDKFWFLYVIRENQPTLANESPAEVMPGDNDHYIMWYRSGSWAA